MAHGSGYDAATRLIHLLLAVLGVAALVSGQFAGDYRRALHPGFDIHTWIGLGMALALAARIAWGFAGPAPTCFSQWLPVTRERLKACWQDLVELARLRLPLREGHDGIAGLVQAIGLAAFAWLGASGVLMWLYLEPGVRASGWMRTVKELHEGGGPLAIAYVAIHVSAVLLHSLAGHRVWQRIAPWSRGGQA
jgi:cytochrome b